MFSHFSLNGNFFFFFNQGAAVVDTIPIYAKVHHHLPDTIRSLRQSTQGYTYDFCRTKAVEFTLAFTCRYQGVTFPAVHALLGRWTPPLERSKMASFTFSGTCNSLNTPFSPSLYHCLSLPIYHFPSLSLSIPIYYFFSLSLSIPIYHFLSLYLFLFQSPTSSLYLSLPPLFSFNLSQSVPPFSRYLISLFISFSHSQCSLLSFIFLCS